MTFNGDQSISSTLTKFVYERLRDDILNKQYEHGEKLYEIELSNKYNVSRTPVREALKLLAMDGLVTDIPNKGCFARGLTDRDIDDIYQIRMVIEELLMPWAIERISDDVFDQMADLVELMEFYACKEDAEKFIELDNRFHRVLYDAVESPLIGSIMGAYLTLIQESRIEGLKHRNRFQASLKEHQLLIEALRNRSLESALEYSRSHCLGILRYHGQDAMVSSELDNKLRRVAKA